jgi:uncharacterized protein involved in exopolysaccharide biosynthesis
VLQSQLAAKELEQTQLARSVDNAKQLYDVLLQRQEEARIAAASQADSEKLVAKAVIPDRPLVPHKNLNNSLRKVLGFIARSVLASVLEYFSAFGPARGASTARWLLPSVAMKSLKHESVCSILLLKKL